MTASFKLSSARIDVVLRTGKTILNFDVFMIDPDCYDSGVDEIVAQCASCIYDAEIDVTYNMPC